MAVHAAPAAPALSRLRVADYLELTKPRIASLVLVTVAAGFLLAGGSGALALVHTVLGTALVAAGASTLNQLIERHSDSLMSRTENRPLPSGRLQPAEVLLFGLALGVGGFLYLLLALPSPLAAIIAAASFLLYVLVYTPLKQKTVANTLIGAVPGALPPLIGWAAARGSLGMEALALFLILFFWQLPHFFAIAWIYRHQYAQAGLRMLPVLDPDGSRTGRSMILHCCLLLAASLLPFLLDRAGVIYLTGAVLLGGGFLASTWIFWRQRRLEDARLVLRASLVYLPALLLGALADRTLSWLIHP